MTDAEKREKVIRGLERCSGTAIFESECPIDCPYYLTTNPLGEDCCERLIKDALDLLKEQEARVLEYSEIEGCPLVWLEYNNKDDVIPALFLQYAGWGIDFSRQAPDKYVDTIIRSAKVIYDERMYNIKWRAWTARPTNEQRKVAKWG